MKSFHDYCRRTQGGFSLFEIVVSMTILGIISSAVLSILWQAGDSAAEIRNLDRNDEEVSRFLILLRESIENLPPEGTLAMTPAAESASGFDELVIGNSSTAFTFGEKVGGSEETVIALRPSPPRGGGEPLFDLAISRADFGPDEESNGGMAFRAGPDDLLQADEEGRYWLPLMSGVTIAAWRFWDDDQREWLDEWTDENAMPPLLEFSLGGEFRPVPMRVVFNVPEQAVNPDEAAEAATAGTSNTNTTSTSSAAAAAANARQRGQGDRGEGRSDRGEGGKSRGPGGGDGAGRGGKGGAKGGGGKGPPRGGQGPGGGGPQNSGPGRPGGGGAPASGAGGGGGQ